MTTTVARGRVLAPVTLFLWGALVAFGCAPKQDELTITTDTTGTGGTAAVPAPGAPALDDTTRAGTPSSSNTMPTAPATPPDHIEVQHVLIGFEGKVPGKPVTRSQAEAEKLAGEILERARKGEDFDQLVQKYTDDAWPGIYLLANTGITPAQGEYPRSGMVKGFSDVAFSLSPGNVAVADYDAKLSPFGWHIIKRVK
ncbi:MAG: peptidylprolyl isomerase [Candidatus Eisenbacteria bacterium]